jgi:hypothetical protein
LASREELTALKDRIKRKPFDRIYEALVRRCSLILEASPVNEQHWRRGWEHGSWDSAVMAAQTTQGRIMDLLIAHHIDRNFAFRDRAIEELRNLTAWSTWVDPCHGQAHADLCTAEAAVAAAVGLDWLWEDLGEPDRLRIIQAIRHKAIEPYRKAVSQQAWWHSVYHNWNAVVNSGCAIAGLALGDDEPAAQEVYNMALGGLRHFFDALGREGGWDEGTGYWGYAMRYVLLLAEAARRTMDDQRLLHMRGMDATGAFPVYFTPNGQAASFGDNPAVPLFGALYLLVKHYGQNEIGWWLDHFAYRQDVVVGGWSSAGLGLLFRPIDAEITKPSELAPVKVFHEIGWAAMADHWPEPAFYVAAKTGDLSANHSQRDMNSIQFQVDGEMLLTDPGHAPFSRAYFSDARGEFYQVQARSHNTLIVGQRDHQIDAQGEIIEAGVGVGYHYLACDAETACGDDVHFVRHLVMILDAKGQKAHTLVVLDELTGKQAEALDLFWHSLGQIDLNRSLKCGSIAGQKSCVYFALAATTGESVVTLEQHSLQPQQTESIIHLKTVLRGKAFVASVFSRKALTEAVEIHPAAGAIHVKAGAISLHFKARKRHLQLEEVTLK